MMSNPSVEMDASGVLDDGYVPPPLRGPAPLYGTDKTSTPDGPTNQQRVQGALSILPVQDLPKASGLPVLIRRGPGRPRQVEAVPHKSDLEYHAVITAEKEKFIDNDPLVLASHNKADTGEMLRRIKGEMAKEAAALHFQRIENDKRGKDTSALSTKRVEALQKMAALELDMKKIESSVIDLQSERMQKIMSSWVQSMVEVLSELSQEGTLDSSVMDLFLNKFEVKMDGWEKRLAEQLSRIG